MHGRELIVFLAMAMALSALGIDLLLPAFPEIRTQFGLEPGSTTVSRFITAYFVGLAGGQLLIGPLADRFGRRTLFRAGILLYALGAGLTIVAPTFTTLLVARFVWGLGAATGRVLAVAIVRDRFVGAAMARTISLIMAVFVTVPVIAPAVGVVLLRYFTWDQLVLLNLVAASLVLVWTLRLGETLPTDARRPLSVRAIGTATLRVVRHPASGPLVLAQAVLFGGFASYLSTSEVIYREVFASEALFPVLFGGMALTMGIATLINGRLVERIGLTRMLRIDLSGYLTGASALLVLAVATGGGATTPPLRPSARVPAQQPRRADPEPERESDGADGRHRGDRERHQRFDAHRRRRPPRRCHRRQLRRDGAPPRGRHGHDRARDVAAAPTERQRTHRNRRPIPRPA